MKLLGAKVQEITRMEIGTHVVTIAHISTRRRYTVLVHVHMYTFIKVHLRDRGTCTTIVVF